MQAKDIFDVISPDEEDVFTEIESEDSAVENIKKQMSDLLEKFDAKDRKNDNRKLSDEIKNFIREEISKIKPKQNVIERQVEQVIKHVQVPVHLEPKIIKEPAPPQIIKEVRVEVEKKDKTKYVEESKYLDLLVKVSKLENQLKETRRMAESPIVMPGGSGVIGIPAPEPNPEGYVLTVGANRKAQWKAATGGSGASISGYTVNNGSTLKTFDVTDTSLDEIARVLGSLLTDLQS